jgi:hypothetical protein
MVIDFNTAKNYRINKFIDFLEKIKENSPIISCDSHYYARGENRVDLYLNAREDKNIDGKFVSQISLWTTDSNTRKYFQIIAYLEANKEFAYIRLWQNGKQYIIMRNNKGEVYQLNTCIYYPPQEVLPISKETRDIFEEAFDACFIPNLPNLEAHPKCQGVLDTLAEVPNECNNRSRFTVIK